MKCLHYGKFLFPVYGAFQCCSLSRKWQNISYGTQLNGTRGMTGRVVHLSLAAEDRVPMRPHSEAVNEECSIQELHLYPLLSFFIYLHHEPSPCARREQLPMGKETNTEILNRRPSKILYLGKGFPILLT